MELVMEKRIKLKACLMTFAVAASSYGLVGCGTEFNTESPVEEETGTLPVEEDTGTTSRTVFDGTLSSNWQVYDCCGETTPGMVTDATNGSVYEFTGAIAETNLGFSAIEAIDISGFGVESTLNFELKIDTFPTTTPNTDWTVKVQSNGGLWVTPAGEESAFTISFSDLPAAGEWKSFSFSITDMANNDGLDLAAIDKIAISPAWGNADGAVYYIDNIEFVDLDVTETPTATASAIFEGVLGTNWSVYDCCGGTTPTTVNDATNGTVFEFSGAIADTNLGFSASNGLNISGFGIASSLDFDLKIVTLPTTADTDWAVKVQSNGGLYVTPAGEESAFTISAADLPAVGEWSSFSFDVADMINAGLDVTSIDKIAISPAYGSADGALYYIDNVKFVDLEAAPAIVEIADVTKLLAENTWTTWGSSYVKAYYNDRSAYDELHPDSVVFETDTSTAISADTTASIEVVDAASGIDLTGYEETGVLSFDLRLDNDVVVGDTWNVRLYSGDKQANLTFLANSQEKIEPTLSTWGTFTYNLSDFVAANGDIDMSNITEIRIYPAWGTAIEVKYNIANLSFYQSGAN